MAYLGNIGSLLKSGFKASQGGGKKPSKYDRLAKKEIKQFKTTRVLLTVEELKAKYNLQDAYAKGLSISIKRRLTEQGIAVPKPAKKSKAGQASGATNAAPNAPTEAVDALRAATPETPPKIVVEAPQEVKAVLQDIRSKYGDEIRTRGEQTTIPEGFIYLVTHPLFEGWVKAGMTIDYEQRMVTYNISDPLSRFELTAVKWVENRRKAEKDLLALLEDVAQECRGEWFRVELETARRVFDGE